MKLLHWETLKTDKRIPRSTEEKTVDALKGIETFGAPKVEIIMVSHQWLRPSLNKDEANPDTVDNLKALSLNEFSDWRRNWVMRNHGFHPEIFYWIDFSCLDQNKPDIGVPLLPLWVACCERFLMINTPAYNERAWCRLEPLLSHVFSFADHLNSIDLDFKSKWPLSGIEKFTTLLDPIKGKTTDPKDISLIKDLVEITINSQSTSKSEFNITRIKTFHL